MRLNATMISQTFVAERSYPHSCYAGGYGFATEFDVERKWRETRLYRVAPISTNLIMSFVAQNVLGLPRSY